MGIINNSNVDAFCVHENGPHSPRSKNKNTNTHKGGARMKANKKSPKHFYLKGRLNDE